MQQKIRLLKTAKRIISIPNFPQRYRIAEVVTRRVTGNSGLYVGNLGRYEVAFDFSDQLQRAMYFELYDQPEINLLKKLLKKGDIFFDVGAYLGYYSLVASQLVGDSGQVHAFEPVPRLADNLKAIVKESGAPNITVNQVAVGEKDGRISIHVADQSSKNLATSSIFENGNQGATIVVDRISLDSYCEINSIHRADFMKIDIEGSERECLLGMKSLLALTPPPDLLIEINPTVLRSRGLSSVSLTDLLFQVNYRLFKIQDFPFRLIPILRENEITSLINVYCTARSLPDGLHKK